MTINNGKGRLVCINWDGVDRSAWQLIFNFEQIAFLNLQMIPQSFQKLHIAPRWTLCVTADGRSAPTACTGWRCHLRSETTSYPKLPAILQSLQQLHIDQRTLCVTDDGMSELTANTGWCCHLRQMMVVSLFCWDHPYNKVSELLAVFSRPWPATEYNEAGRSDDLVRSWQPVRSVFKCTIWLDFEKRADSAHRSMPLSARRNFRYFSHIMTRSRTWSQIIRRNTNAPDQRFFWRNVTSDHRSLEQTWTHLITDSWRRHECT